MEGLKEGKCHLICVDLVAKIGYMVLYSNVGKYLC